MMLADLNIENHKDLQVPVSQLNKCRALIGRFSLEIVHYGTRCTHGYKGLRIHVTVTQQLVVHVLH